MKSTLSLPAALRGAAAALLVAALATWTLTGAHVGWTQTSAVALQHDEITGIDYPVRHDVFVAGLELLLGGIGLAAIVAASSYLPRIRRVVAVRG